MARQRKTTVLVGRCWEGSGAPAFWPWVQIVRAYLQQCEGNALSAELGPGAAAIAQVIPDVHDHLSNLPILPELEPEQARFLFFAG